MQVSTGRSFFMPLEDTNSEISMSKFGYLKMIALFRRALSKNCRSVCLTFLGTLNTTFERSDRIFSRSGDIALRPFLFFFRAMATGGPQRRGAHDTGRRGAGGGGGGGRRGPRRVQRPLPRDKTVPNTTNSI